MTKRSVKIYRIMFLLSRKIIINLESFVFQKNREAILYLLTPGWLVTSRNNKSYAPQ